MRDALVAALTGLLDAWQARSDLAVALADPLRSVQQYLAALGADRGAGQMLNEDEEAFRARLIQQRQSVTEQSIIAGVNAILALVTTTQCQLVDSALDGWFINDGTNGNGGEPVWNSFVGAGPNYPDRYFADDALNNGGTVRPNSEVGGARLFKDTLGRLFLLRVPDLGYQQGDASFVDDGSSPSDVQSEPGGFFVFDGSGVPSAGYIDANDTDPLSIYRAIGNFVNLAAGQSVRWSLLPLEL